MRYALHVTGLLLAANLATAQAAAPQPWVARSNQLAEPVLVDRAQFLPEAGSQDGREEFDTQVVDLKPQVFERQLASFKARREALMAQLATETDPKVKQDLEILIASRDLAISQTEVTHHYLLDAVSAAQLVYWGLDTLLDARNKPARQAHALVRLKRYAGLEEGFTPIATLAQERTAEDLARTGLTGPFVDGLQRQLDNTAHYLQGLSALFTQAKLTGWESDLAVLSQQLRAYDDWLRQQVLPRARHEARLPGAVYADFLKQVGVDAEPDVLMESASFNFAEVRDEMQVLARHIAAKHHWPSGDYRAVLARLKLDQMAPHQVLPRYRQRLREMETIIRREKLVTLPKRQPVIRIATDAEAAEVGAPFMRPPRLIGNTGEYGEFVLPLSNPHAKSKAKMDDSTFDAITWTLAAHEARPGHELQFSAMVEQGTSVARAIFADNSANTEGWALYSEALMLPFMPPEGQLASLQMRLLRMARAFLDPMVNLGRISTTDAKRVLMEQVVLSEPDAQQEVDRYAFNSPGQATAYYYGYTQLRAIRTQAEIALGKQFNLMAFNDFVLAQGLLPPRLLKQAVMQEFVPAQMPGKSP
jgi:hypothetical protein